MSSRPSPSRLFVLALTLVGFHQMGVNCGGTGGRTQSGHQLFTSPQTNPVAVSADGALVYVANTTSGTLSVIETTAPYDTVAEIPVGLDPVGVAVRPKVVPGDPQEDELIFVTNHISDTISVVNRTSLQVVQTIQELDGNGVTNTDEPVGVVFNGPNQAFATLDHSNEVIELTVDGQGVWSIGDRATITSQAPRALTVANGRVYVAAFESGNQSEFPTCGASDPVNFNRGDPVDEGCLFPLNLPTLLQFATSPNIGGEVIHDGDLPDRDLFVFDANDLAGGPIQSVEGLGTLLYGVASAGDKVFITTTDARNKEDGLLDLDGRMFDNKLAILDCNPSCGAPSLIDLESPARNSFGVPVPTPYGVAASGDGNHLVVSVAGSDGVPADLGDSSTVDVDIPGLVVIDTSNGDVLGHVQIGAIPQGLALVSNGSGVAQTAYALNTVDSTLSIVDVSNPAAPSVTATLPVGSDPTPDVVRRGRIQFSSARASTTGTFSCESCHPNGNIDQILWTINTDTSPADPGGGCSGGVCPEPRSTMPIRGLRDTLPLHWVGNLADPFPGLGPEDDGAPDCDIDVDGEVGCIRHLVNASLSGVMCERPCSTGPTGLDGALTDDERNDMAAFMAAVAFPPSPTRRPSDVLSTPANDGVRDFFSDQGGLGGLIGGVSNCADNAGGCHSLPLTVDTNSPVVGGFDAPSIRGLWDRHITFSNGFTSSEEHLSSVGFSPSAGGMSEFGSLAASFPNLFTLAYGIPVSGVWALINEMSVGLPGLTGRQVEVTPDNRLDGGVGAQLAQIEAAANEGRITAVARIGTTDYRMTQGLWKPQGVPGFDTDSLRDLAVTLDTVITVTAELPSGISIGGADRQPLLSADLSGGDPPSVAANSNVTVTLDQAYVDPGAAILIDGVVCGGCAIESLTADEVELRLNPSPGPANSMHVVQVLNPSSFASNEMPICAGNCP